MWLKDLYFARYREVPGSQPVEDALDQIEHSALTGAEECPVYIRVGEYQSKIYLDLANDAWEVVEIDSVGWRVLKVSPVRFRRTPAMLPLPYPQPGGRIEDLWPFLNTSKDQHRVLIVGFLIGCLRPQGPYPVLDLGGEQGSAKTTTARGVRGLVDPATAGLRPAPRSERDLVIAASNSWLASFDNLSSVPCSFSDAICRLATGGGFGTRKLYTNADEELFDIQRPVLLNGIDDLAVRSDLADRAIKLHLPPIPPDKRRTESEFWAEFEKARPRILGALLDAVSMALARYDHLGPRDWPRMADFAKWVTAAEEAFGWAPGTFIGAYEENLAEARQAALEDSALAAAIRKLLEGPREWRGNATALLEALMPYRKAAHFDPWPCSPTSFKGELRRLAPSLRASGIDVEFLPHGRTIILRLREVPGSSVTSVTSATPSPTQGPQS